VNNINFDTHTYGIDTARRTVVHELQHKLYYDYIKAAEACGMSPDTDSDGIPDVSEGVIGTDVGPTDTHDYHSAMCGCDDKENCPSGYCQHGDEEYGASLAALGETGNAEYDWSKGGKQWGSAE